MITATFSLVEQLVSLNVMPPIRIVHTDSTSRGRIFVPAVNFLVLVGTLGLTIGFGTEAGLTNAYGLAVSGVMIITTTILAVAMAQVKHLPVLVAIGYFLLSAFIDGLFFGASLKKVPTGAWFSIGLATILLVLLLGWSWARGLEEQFDKNHRYRLSEIMKPSRGGADAAATEKKDAKEGEGKTKTETAAVAQLERGGEAGPVQRRRPHPPAYEATVGGASLARLPVFALYVARWLRFLRPRLIYVSRSQLPQPFLLELRRRPSLLRRLPALLPRPPSHHRLPLRPRRRRPSRHPRRPLPR